MVPSQRPKPVLQRAVVSAGTARDSKKSNDWEAVAAARWLQLQCQGWLEPGVVREPQGQAHSSSSWGRSAGSLVFQNVRGLLVHIALLECPGAASGRPHARAAGSSRCGCTFAAGRQPSSQATFRVPDQSRRHSGCSRIPANTCTHRCHRLVSSKDRVAWLPKSVYSQSILISANSTAPKRLCEEQSYHYKSRSA
jgi:hypothetical protein